MWKENTILAFDKSQTIRIAKHDLLKQTIDGLSS